MATIVYDGVGGGGNLFAGKKFCFLVRVPSRLRWMELVESNGGEIVKLEKQADIVIADHAHKGAPAGSVSWTYIEASAKKGELEDIENHRAGTITRVAREVGSGGPTKKFRTPFTKEDDRILMDWVMKGERAGISVMGNELFKQLEEKNNRHPFQSWRDRWIKHVQYYSRPEVRDASPDSFDGPVPVSTLRNKPISQKKPAAPSTPELKRNSILSQQALSSTVRAGEKRPSAGSVTSNKSRQLEPSSAIPFVGKSSRGMYFTKKEIRLLFEEYDAIMDIDEDKAIDAWATWAMTYPSHTAQEWRNYFTKELAPLVEKHRQQESNEDVRPTKPSQPSGRVEAESPPSVVDVDMAGSRPVTTEKLVDPSTEDEKLFRKLLADFAEELEDGLEIELNPIICGRTIPLFKLWQTVMSEEFGGSENVTGHRLWPLVARKLNFNDFQHAEAAKDLESCYEEILADFEVTREAYNSLTESQEQAMIELQLFASGVHDLKDGQIESGEEEEDFDDDLEAPLVSPTLQPSKRSMAQRSDLDQSSIAGSYNKRQRIDTGKGKEPEIPSTPEDIINGNQMPRTVYGSSPLKSSWPFKDENREGSEDDGLMRPFQQPDFSGLQPVEHITEPKTQDLLFVSQEEGVGGYIERNLKNFKSISPSSYRKSATKPRSGLGAMAEHYDETSTESQTESQTERQLQEFIDHHVSLCYTHAHVLEALDATTMNTGDAGVVMENLHQGRGIPENIQGVWTTRDDAAFDDEESLELERIVAKHGMKRVMERRKYLEDKREASRLLDGSSPG